MRTTHNNRSGACSSDSRVKPVLRLVLGTHRTRQDALPSHQPLCSMGSTMLTEFELRNFKCFEALKLKLAPLTLLCGLNGTGKSSLMQALLLLRQSHEAGELDKGSLELRGEFVDLGTGQDVIFEDATSDSIGFSLRRSDAPETLVLNFEYIKSEDRLAAMDVASRVAALGPQSNNARVHQDTTAGDFFPFSEGGRSWGEIPPLGGRVMYVNTEGIGPPEFHLHSEELAGRGDMGTRGDFALNYLASIQDQRLRENDPRCEGIQSRSLVSIVENWLQDVSPSAYPKLETVTDGDAIITGFSFDRPKDIEARRYRSTRVGSGLSYIIPVLVALLEPKGSLCMIEHPESHLHPRGQTRLAELAVRASLAGVQVIIETHSDHFLDGIRIAVRDDLVDPSQVAIHYFQRMVTRAEVSSPTIDSNGRVSFWPQGFFDQHEENLSRLLAPRK